MPPTATTLSAADLANLERALGVAVSPLDFPSVEQWGAALMASWRPVLTADQAFFAHSLNGAVVVQADAPLTERAGREYARHSWQVDPALTARRKQLRLDDSRDDVYDRLPRTEAELFVDWCTPNRLNDVIALKVETGGAFTAALHFYHDHEDRNPFGERGLQLLRLLLPAFQAGIATYMRLAAHRAQLTSWLDAARDGLALFDADGRPLHRNPALNAMLAAEPERARIVHALSAAGSRAAALTRRDPTAPRIAATNHASVTPLFRELRTAAGQYRLAATHLASIAGRSDAPLILVSLTRGDRKTRSDGELQTRFRLTKREVEVARLLASGLRTGPLATTLNISVHTARRHTERVLSKLGIESRAGVAEALSD
jgi:DNA-binding NarL/FixJ family response regulator